MFGLFNKEVEIFAPVSGKVINIEDVQDEVFSKKMMGDGLAIIPSDNTFFAPCDGELTMVFKTGHAFGMKLDKNIEILVHIGIDTVELNGEGFEILQEQGTKIKKGTPIIKINSDFIREKGYNLVTPIIVTYPEAPKSLEKFSGEVVASQNVILKVQP